MLEIMLNFGDTKSSVYQCSLRGGLRMDLVSMIMHFLAYAICTSEVVYVSLVLLRLLEVQSTAKRIAALGLFSCAQMILAVEALSLIESICLRNLLLVHSSICAVLLLFRIKPASLFLKSGIFALIRGLSQSTDKYLKVMLIVTIVGGLTTFGLAVLVPPNNSDSLAYHLPRVGVYMQQGSLKAFPTADLRQTAFPANAEILALWQTVLLRNDRTLGLIQWLAWCGCILAVYAIARNLNIPVGASLFAGLACGSLSEVVLQSTSTQNDLLAGFFVIGSLLFFMEAPGKNPLFSELILPALGLSLAIGTKATTALIFPGVAVFVINFWAKRKWLTLSRVTALIAICSICVFLWGSYIYIQNFRIYGSPSGPPVFRAMHLQEELDLSVAWSNFGRLLLQFLNPSDNIPPLAGIRKSVFRGYFRFTEWAFNHLHISERIPAKDFPGGFWEDISRAPFLHEDFSSYGVGFAYLLLPISLLSLFAPSLLRLESHARFLALASLSYWVLISFIFRWNIWMGRFMMPTVLLASPMFACLWMRQKGILGKICKGTLVGLCSTSIILNSLQNASKPVIGSANIFGKDRIELMVGGPYLPGFQFINNLDIKGLRLGVVSSVDYRLYQFFGPHFEREVIPIRFDREELLDTKRLPQVDCMLFYSNTQAYFPAGKVDSPTGPFYVNVNLDPLLSQIKDPKSTWQAFHINGFGDLYARGRQLQAIRDKIARITPPS